MISEEKFDLIIKDLEEKFLDTSDLISIETEPYSEFITSEGKMDNRKKYFYIVFTMINYNLRATRFAEVASELFFKLNEWMSGHSDVYFFHDVKVVSREDQSLKVVIYFNDIKSITKRILSK